MLNYTHSSSVITIIAHNSVEWKKQGIYQIDGFSYSVRKIDNNNNIDLSSKKAIYNELYYYYFNVEPGAYEIKMTTNKKSVSLDFLMVYDGSLEDLFQFDSIVIKNAGDKINITDLSHAFYFCPYLKSIDLTIFDMSGVTNFRGIFIIAKV